jgi:pimeloyl-ACP methyl ester carboxylesterase
MFGHSIGGAAAVEAAYRFAAVSAAVDLDGTPRGDVVTRGTDEPVGVMLSNIRDALPPPGDTELALLLANLRGPHPVRHLSSIGHDGFTDFAVLTPQALAADPAVGALLAGPSTPR